MPIFDQGYQHWTGALSGHAWRWLPIARRGVQAGSSGRLLRYALYLAWLPALLLVAVLCVWGLLERGSDLITAYAPQIEAILKGLGFRDPAILTDPRQYRLEFWTLSYSYFMWAELGFSMVLILLVGPNLISQDLRYNALPLYFSRPLWRIDYFLGKLGVIMAFLVMVIVIPPLVAYLFGLLFSLDITIVRDTFGLILSVVVYGLTIAVSAGTLMLALSCLSRNSRYVALLWLVIWLVSSAVAGILTSVEHHQSRHRARAAGLNTSSEEFLTELQRDGRDDWRPLFSYTANLSRIGRQLLGTDAAWIRLSQAQPRGQQSRFLLNRLGPQHPWYWSAAVLVGLFGLSVGVLNFSIKSLDRLK
jgi:ABC-2 type transport system permease protein